jgi:hypothetical protein
VTVRADASALLAKMAAMTAHASQIGPQWLDHSGFAGAYGREWFVRQGPPGLLDALVRDLARSSRNRVAWARRGMSGPRRG